MVFARSFAMVRQSLGRRFLRRQEPRTAMRHIPLEPCHPLRFFAFALLNAALFFLSCLLFLPNKLPILLSCLCCSSSEATATPNDSSMGSISWLGAALMLAPICTLVGHTRRGWFKPLGRISFPPLFHRSLGVLLWVTGFDIIYPVRMSPSIDNTNCVRYLPAGRSVEPYNLSARLCTPRPGEMWLLIGLGFPCLFAGLDLVCVFTVASESCSSKNIDGFPQRI